MRLTALLLTVSLMEVHAGGTAQNVTLSGKQLTLKTVFSQIKRQTGFAFFYNYSLLRQAHPVDLNVRDMPLVQVLDSCFAHQPLDYVIQNKTVVITEKEASVTSPVELPDPVNVRGRVLDNQGNPVAGASVRIKGAKTGASTDVDGVFDLKVPAGTVLIISSVGYTEKSITVTKDGAISIHLDAANKEVNEVVVTGFGETRQKRTLGYSVTQVSGDDIRGTMVANPISALQGMVTGLQVQPG